MRCDPYEFDEDVGPGVATTGFKRALNATKVRPAEGATAPAAMFGPVAKRANAMLVHWRFSTLHFLPLVFHPASESRPKLGTRHLTQLGLPNLG